MLLHACIESTSAWKLKWRICSTACMHPSNKHHGSGISAAQTQDALLQDSEEQSQQHTCERPDLDCVVHPG